MKRRTGQGVGGRQRRPSSASGGRATTGWKDARVYAGRIIDLDPVRWACTVKTEVGDKNLYDVDVGSAYLHPFDGEGMHIMPAVGAPVWVCVSSEGDYPAFIMRYRGYPSKTVNNDSQPSRPNLASNRPRMSPGDIVLQTRDRNGLKLRIGKVTEISGSPLARTIYSGRTGVVHTMAKHLKLDTLGGSFYWTVSRAEKDPDGHQGTLADFKVKEFADHRAYVARVETGGQIEVPTEGVADGGSGTHGAAPASAELVSAPVVRLRVYQNGDVEENDLAEALSLGLDKDGQAELALIGQLNIEIRGDSNVTLKLKPDGTVELDTDSDYTVTSGGSHVHQVGAGKTHTIKAAGALTEKVVLGETFLTDLLASLTEVSTLLTALAGGTPPPTTTEFLAQLAASLAAGAPYLSNVTSTE